MTWHLEPWQLAEVVLLGLVPLCADVFLAVDGDHSDIGAAGHFAYEASHVIVAKVVPASIRLAAIGACCCRM